MKTPKESHKNSYNNQCKYCGSEEKDCCLMSGHPQKKKYSRKWERIDRCNTRLRVHNGWIVRTYGLNTVFIPDPNNEWILEDEKK